MTDISKWNSLATRYVEWLGNPNDNGFVFNQALVEAIFRRLPVEADLTVLDLGCGDGSMLNLLSNRYKKVLGIDGAEKIIEIAKRKYPELAEVLLVDDISRQLPIDDNSVDVILCNMVLMDVENIETTVSEIHRVLKCGGVFIQTTNHPSFSFVTDNHSHPDKRYTNNFHYEKPLNLRYKSICNHYHRPIQYYVALLLQAGLAIRGFEEISIDSYGNEELKKYHLTANALLIESHKLS